MTRRRRLDCLALAVVGAVLLAACGATGPTGDGDDALRPAATMEATQTLVTMGSSGTVGAGLEAFERPQKTWPQVLFREAFPRATVLVNAAIEQSSASAARDDQLPLVAEMEPDVVAMWFGSYEAVQEVSPAQFERDLGALVADVRALGARVLLADLPRSNVPTAAYNRAVADVAAEHDLTLVRLSAREVDMFGASDTTFLPTAAGHQVIADAFADALNS